MNQVRPMNGSTLSRSLLACLGWLLLVLPGHAQAPSPHTADSSATMFSHTGEDQFWVSGQLNVIFQEHPAFRSPYSDLNSLTAAHDTGLSDVMTLYAGWSITSATDLLVDVESAGGNGIGQALGLAGFTNLDVVRNPSLGAQPYVARLMLHHTIALTNETSGQTPTYLSPHARVPARRIELYAGKFSLADFFDTNSGGSDSHLQFMNWTVDNNGAWDYAADTRGYTLGVEAEYDDHAWSVKIAEALMPAVANGIRLNTKLSQANATNLEVDWQYAQKHPGTIRVLGYLNHADMGSYAEALAAWQEGEVPTPDVTLSRRPGRGKAGFGLNWEQSTGHGMTLFARYGDSQDKYESFAYTEVANTVEAGATVAGGSWRRPLDHAGMALVSNGISRLHQQYLAAGGVGFLLGDGRLNYGREMIGEVFYTAHVWRGLYFGGDLQAIRNPGYNRDRGPVVVPGLRMHVDF